MRCMVVVKRKGIHIFPYLDDWLLKGGSREEVLAHVDTTLCLLDHLKLILNVVKSTLAPTQKIECIGDLLESTRSRVFLLTDRFQGVQQLSLNLQSQHSTIVLVYLSLLGHMSTFKQVVQLASLYLHHL